MKIYNCFKYRVTNFIGNKMHEGHRPTARLFIDNEQTWTSAIPKTLRFEAGPLTCNAVNKKFCACHDLRTIGMSSSSMDKSPTDCPNSSNNSPPATLTGTCQQIRKL